MKTKNIILGCLILLLSACYKDDSTLAIKELKKISITGIEDEYIHKNKSVLEITPQISGKDTDYEYFWILHYIQFVDGDEKVIVDTIGREFKLEHFIELTEEKSYNVTFKAIDKKTDIFESKTTVIKVLNNPDAPTFRRGWYFLKDKEDGFTDVDFDGAKGFVPNMFNKKFKRSLEGKPASISFQVRRVERAVIQTLVLSSDKEMSVLETDEFNKSSFDVQEAFFGSPPAFKENLWFNNFKRLYFFNDGKIFNSGKLALDNFFGFPTLVLNQLRTDPESDYSLSKHVLVSKVTDAQNRGETVVPLVFDTKTSTFYSAAFAGLKEYTDNRAKPLPTKNLNSDILYADYRSQDEGWEWTWPVLPGEFNGIALLKKRDNDALHLFHLDMGANKERESDIFTKNLVRKIDTLKSPGQIKTAELYAVNRDDPYLYYTNANKISSYNILSQEEKEIHSLPAGEQITFIKHYKYTENDDIGTVLTSFDKLVVASYSGGNYKVYFFELENGIPNVSNPEILEGQGKLADIIFISPKIKEFSSLNLPFKF